MDYLWVKVIHILSATLLFGTGLGTAFYMFVINRTGERRAIAAVTRFVVLADWLFTAPTVILQPITGIYLARLAGFPLDSTWLVWTYALYLLAGACWLPVVWLQIKMRDMAQVALHRDEALPARYWRYERAWVLLGIPAFLGLIVVYWLMVFKPM